MQYILWKNMLMVLSQEKLVKKYFKFKCLDYPNT